MILDFRFWILDWQIAKDFFYISEAYSYRLLERITAKGLININPKSKIPNPKSNQGLTLGG
jgi:hypothetical protein